ncbi:ATP-grasp domain-containing protein [Alkalicoccus urumqiensis]|uniref:Alpha-L-glutamate ligase n=1 Tax=Alkalicoccus urumqiensis TaxID=1548213 RepID=A0A2P6MD25_ALKUR|nr:alpha-L-glutamate ligase [Alkalicoccus urumqiensis]PRO64189.1 alpha-L-glutamate ligase [Alkalicoccus urumqiensis]
MKKVIILHENDAWTAPLKTELEKRDVPYETWHLHEGEVPLHETPPDAVYYNRMSASSHSRGHRYAPELTAAVLNWLERHNRTVLNGSRALYLELSKAAQYEALKAHDIPVPETTAVVGDTRLIEASRNMPLPFITKHNRAGKGLGVKRFDSTEELEQVLSQNMLEPSIDGVMLLQKYIDAPDNTITRCEFIDGKFLYAVRVDTSGGFELCPADACAVDETPQRPPFEIIDDFQSPLIAKYEAFLQENGISFAGIEQITDADGNTFTYDVNTNTNYNSDAETVYGRSGMSEMAEVLKQYASAPLVKGGV